jgi:uncharacterized membrane protein (UPF0127 family)
VKRLLLVGMLITLVPLPAGCDSGTPSPRASGGADPDLPQRAQSRLPTLKLWLGAEEIAAEIARTPDQIQTGMMFRTSLGEREGMLFVFPRPRQQSFWMKNVTVPLTCAYIDPEGTILEIHDMEPGEEKPIFSTSRRIQYVLEMNRGWFERHGIGKGVTIRTERGSLAETFFRDR